MILCIVVLLYTMNMNDLSCTKITVLVATYMQSFLRSVNSVDFVVILLSVKLSFSSFDFIGPMRYIP